jgi:branched-chain amino acid transport system substrate-binding protein
MKTISQSVLGVLLMVGSGVLLAGCGDAPAGEGGQGDVVNIGFSGPLSGGAAFYGRNVMNGLTMAAEELNEAGGIEVDGRRVRVNLVALDDHYLPNETATNARRLVQQSRARVIVVPHAGGVLALQGMNTRNPSFLIHAYTSEPRVLDANNPLTLMIPPRFDSYAEPFVRTTMERFGLRLAMIPTTTAYGRAWTEMISAEWQRQGGTVGRNYGVDYNTTVDFSGAVTQALAERPDVIFVGGPSQPTALVVRAARQQGFTGGFIMMDQAKFEEMLEVVPMDFLEGSVGVHPQETYPAPGTERFVARYYERFGRNRPPTSEVALNYQGLHIVARAMELAGTTSDAEAIRAQATEAIATLPTERQVFEMGEVAPHGFIDRLVVAAQVLDGAFVAMEMPSVE